MPNFRSFRQGFLICVLILSILQISSPVHSISNIPKTWTDTDSTILRNVSTFLKKVGRREFKFPDGFQKRLRKIDEALGNYNFPRAYKLLPVKLGPERRGIGIRITGKDKKLVFQRIKDPKSIPDRTKNLTEAAEILIWAELFPRGKNVYGFRQKVRVGLGQIGPEQIKFASRRIREFLTPPDKFSDRPVWRKLNRSRNALNILRLDVNHGQFNPPFPISANHTMSRFSVKPRYSLLSKKYKSFAKHLKNLRNMTKGKFKFFADGIPIFHQRFASGKKVQFYFKPAPQGLISLNEVYSNANNYISTFSAKQNRLSGKVRVDISSITARINDIQGRIRQTELSPDSVSWKWQPIGKPSVKYEGNIWGFIPMWLVEFLTFNSPEKMAKNFLNVLLEEPPKGLHGKGSIQPIQSNSSNYVFKSSSQGQVLHNNFISFSRQVANNRLKLGVDAREDYRKILRTLGDAIQKDLEKIYSKPPLPQK